MKKIPSLLATAVLLTHAQNSLADDSDTIFVTAKAPLTAEEFSGSVSVVTAEDIKASGAINVIEALATIPGVTVGTSSRGASQTLKIRGFDADQSLILVNGKRIPNIDRNVAFGPGYRYDWVPLKNIERIEVIRGAASSLYGADALAGVINIITRQAGDEWSGTISTTAQAFDGDGDGGDGHSVSLNAAGPLSDAVDLSVALEQKQDDILLNSEGNGLSPERDAKTIQADLGIDLNATDRLEFSLLAGKEDGHNIDAGNTELLEQDRSLYGVNYTTQLGGFNFATGLSLSKSDIVDESNERWEIREDNFSLGLDGALNDANYLSAGLLYREEGAERAAGGSVANGFDQEFRSVNLFLENRTDLNDSHSITLGLSADDHNRYDSELSPKAYWNWQLNDAWTMKTGYSEAYQAPAIREGSSEYNVSIFPGFGYVGNDDLKPETSKTFEWSLAYSADSFDASVALFDTQIKDLITVDFTPGVRRYVNINDASVKGAELAFAWQATENGKLSLNYTYLDTENETASSANNGNELDRQPEHSANLKYTQAFPSVDTSAYLGISSNSMQFANDANTSTIRSYTTFDVGVNKQLGENIEVSFAIDNITDEQVLDTVTNGGSTSLRAIEAGREYRLSLAYNF